MLDALKLTLVDLWSRNVAEDVRSTLKKAASLIGSVANFNQAGKGLSQSQVDELFEIPLALRIVSRDSLPMVVLDLDETLVHTRSSQPPQHDNYQQVQYLGEPMYIETRPYLQQFLEVLSSLCVVVVYTAGRQPYADLILDVIDPNRRYFTHRFYREHCVPVCGKLRKDLSLISKLVPVNRAGMLLVDDNEQSVLMNHPHSIEADCFEGDQEDQYLLTVFAILMRRMG